MGLGKAIFETMLNFVRNHRTEVDDHKPQAAE
jgi:hypothetical protein